MEFIKRSIKQPTTTGLTQGYWDAQANIPDITSVTETGYMWYVSVSGNTMLGEINNWEVGDWATKNSVSWGKVINGISGSSGNTLIIPDLASGFSTNFMLSANTDDWGFFDVLEEGQDLIEGSITCDALSASTSGTSVCDTGHTFPSGATISAGTYVVSGETSSRLLELRKFSTSGTLSQLYFTSINPLIDGLDTSKTVTGVTASTYVYYLGGIEYIDEVVLSDTSSTFSFESSGYTSPVFVNLPYIKDDRRQNIISPPLVDNDVFIVRDENSAFQDNYRLRDIGNLTELTYYAGGAYFNIVENT